MADTLLSIASRALLEACARLGLDTDALLSEAGLSREQVFDPDRRLPAERADALWVAAFEVASDPDLALHAAEHLPFGAYKVIDYLAAHSRTVGEAFTRIAAYFPLVDPRAVFEITHGACATILMRTRDAGATIPAAAQQYTFAALVSRLRVVTGSEFRPERVELGFDAPADLSAYRRIFATELRFGAAEPCLVFSRATWDMPVRGADPVLLSLLEDHARRLLAELPRGDDFGSRVRDVITGDLDRSREPVAARVARRLGVSERTLQRRLEREGRTFSGLVDETRAAIAKAYLRDRSLALAEIAFLSGFSDQSAFTRAFRRWTGETPGAFRARMS